MRRSYIYYSKTGIVKPKVPQLEGILHNSKEKRMSIPAWSNDKTSEGYLASAFLNLNPNASLDQLTMKSSGSNSSSTTKPSKPSSSTTTPEKKVDPPSSPEKSGTESGIHPGVIIGVIAALFFVLKGKKRL